MRITVVSGLVAVATLLAGPAFSQSFVGEWTATATRPSGEVSETLKVVRTNGGYEGVVSGDTFTGTANLGGFEVPYNGVRIGRRE